MGFDGLRVFYTGNIFCKDCFADPHTNSGTNSNPCTNANSYTYSHPSPDANGDADSNSNACAFWHYGGEPYHSCAAGKPQL